MTAEEIKRRGPRYCLARRHDNGKLFRYREDQLRPMIEHTVIAKSYSSNYLKRLEKVNA